MGLSVQTISHKLGNQGMFGLIVGLVIWADCQLDIWAEFWDDFWADLAHFWRLWSRAVSL